MGKWYAAPVFDDRETNRQAQMLWRILTTTLALVVLGTVVALVDHRNDPRVTLMVYTPVYLCHATVARLVRHGRVTAAAWVLSICCWLIIALVMLAFGGLQGQNASVFAVCTLLIGSIVGGRAAIGMAVASSAWCAVVWRLEERNALPMALGPYTPANAWVSLTVTVVLTAVLLHESLKSLRAMHERAEKAAAERDEALRGSIQRQKMELVGNLTSGVAHDLNNLLTVIMGTVGLLRHSGNEERNYEPLLNDLEDAASRSALMTTQLLAFGRAKTGSSEHVDVGELLQVYGRMASRLVGSPIEVQLNITSGCWIRVSRSALEQIVLNLVVNARDAMPNGGTLTLTLQGAGERVELTVADTGVGIPPDVMARMFEPFFTTKAKGTGLGLATIRRLITEFGGDITVESKLGVGTTFQVSFPKVEPPAKPIIAPSPEGLEVSARATRVLLVEDDPGVRKALSQALVLEGYDITAVADGDEALVLLPMLSRFGCVITDISMRHVSGDDVADRLAVECPDLPVLIMSGNREPRESPHGVRHVFLAKPVLLADLCRAIRDVTERHGHAGLTSP